MVRAEQVTTTKTVWDGVFTAEQAERGAAAYKTACSECHGNDLVGDGFAPALTGADFMGNWNDLTRRRSVRAHPHLDAAERSEQRDAGAEGRHRRAHLMNMNKFPAGTTELEPKTEVLKTIKIEMKKYVAEFGSAGLRTTELSPPRRAQVRERPAIDRD